MSKKLRPFLSRLKKRRESRSSTYRNDNQSPKDGSGQQDPAIAEQMAGLAISSPSEDSNPPDDAVPPPYEFGTSQDVEFEFKLASSKEWPGPVYDKQSLFAPGVYHKALPVKPKSKQRPSKRKLSQEAGQVTLRAKDRPSVKIVKEAPRSKKPKRPLQYYGAPPTRDPPPHLLNLPGEIRNQIYQRLYVIREPIVAQFRPIFIPKKGRNHYLCTIIRRFPREPGLALGCRQLQHEVLAIFYGKNKFVFRQTEDQKSNNLIMTRAEMILTWSPSLDFAKTLTRVDVHFNVQTVIGRKESIEYELRKLADGRVRLMNNADCDLYCFLYCTCFDVCFLRDFTRELRGDQACENLIKVAAKLVATRVKELHHDDSMVNNGSEFRPIRRTCSFCDLETLKTLESGL